MTVQENLSKVMGRVEAAAIKSGRAAANVTIVAVTKGAAPERILEAAAAGLTVFGENRAQEAEVKIPVVANPALEWHMIGHLQTNKIKQALSLFTMIQSVDSLRLAKEVSR